MDDDDGIITHSSYETTDGRTFASKVKARAHQQWITRDDEFTAFCKAQGIKDGPARSRAANLLKAWESRER